MTDHTPTPTPDACGARHHDAVNAVLVCELPPGHGAHHRAQTTPGEYFNWPDEPEAATHAVHGRCPACGRASLITGTGGYIICGHLECPDPEAVTRLLGRGPVASAGAARFATHDIEICNRDRAAHDAHRLAVSEALGLGTSAPWDAVEERAHELAAMHTGGGKGRTASDVLVEHDVTRKAMCDALDVDYHLNWQQIVAAAQRHHDANAEWQADAEEHRTALADALGEARGHGWGHLIGRAATIRDAATERADLLEEARDALEAAGQAGAHGDDWPAIMPGIRALADAARDARRGEAEAVRAREAAERDRDAAWREAGAARIRSGRNIAEARRYKDAWYNARKRAASLSRQLTDTTADRDGWWAHALELGETLGRRAERAEATLTAVRAQAADWAQLAAPGDVGTTPDDTALAGAGHIVLGILGDPQPDAEPKPREVCCVCGSPDVAYHNCNEQPFCWPCADCGCNQTPCVRTGVNDPAVSAVPEPPCFHPSWETEPTVGARRCTDCGEWLDPQPPTPAETAPVVHVHVTVTPQQVADAVRRILRDDRTTLRDALR